MEDNLSAQPAPFLVVKDYHEEGDLRFGAWNNETEFYHFPNGDEWPLGYACAVPTAMFVTQEELETRIKKSYQFALSLKKQVAVNK